MSLLSLAFCEVVPALALLEGLAFREVTLALASLEGRVLYFCDQKTLLRVLRPEHLGLRLGALDETRFEVSVFFPCRQVVAKR